MLKHIIQLLLIAGFISYPGFLNIRIGISLSQIIVATNYVFISYILVGRFLKDRLVNFNFLIYFLAYLAFSLVFISSEKYIGLQYFIRFSYPFLLLVYFYNSGFTKREIERLFIYIIVVSLFTTLFYFLIHFDYFLLILKHNLSNDLLMYGGYDEIGVNLHILAYFLLIAVLAKDLRKRIFSIKYLFPLIIIFSIVNFKRIAAIALILTVILYYINFFTNKKTLFYVLTGLAVWAASYLLNHINIINSNIYFDIPYFSDLNTLGRGRIWANILTSSSAFDNIEFFVFGKGLGYTKFFQVSANSYYQMLHSGFLTAFLDLGVLGVLVFLWTLKKMIFKAQHLNAIFIVVYYLIIFLTDNIVEYGETIGTLMVLSVYYLKLLSQSDIKSDKVAKLSNINEYGSFSMNHN